MIDIVGESAIDSEKFAVNVTTSELARILSESLSVKVTVGDMVSVVFHWYEPYKVPLVEFPLKSFTVDPWPSSNL